MEDICKSLSERDGESRYTLKRKLKDVRDNCNLFFRNERQELPTDVEAVDGGIYEDQVLEEIGFDVVSFDDLNTESLQIWVDGSQDIDLLTTEDFDLPCEEEWLTDDDSEVESDDSNDEVIYKRQNQSPEGIKESIESDILNWCIEHNIKNKPISKLLKILIKHGLELPKDARALKKTSRRIEIRDVLPGKYWHYGVKSMIDLQLKNGVNLPEALTLDVMIDGLPLYNSSLGNLWPILGKFSQLDTMKPFAIGIYHHSHNKPKDINGFLKDFVSEMKEFSTSSYRTITLKPGLFIMDAAAKATMKKVKHHNGEKSCPFCLTVGQHDGRMSFPRACDEKRTDASFRNRDDPLHHSSKPGEKGLLEELDVNMIDDFPPDYLHVICLGNVKKNLKMLMGTLKFPKTANQIWMFNKTNFTQITNATALCRMSQPKDITRAIRPLSDLAYFKGTELRAFLLYYGLVALKDNVDLMVYKNFVYLQCAITICLSDHYRHFLPLAKELLSKYVEDFKTIYGSCMVSFNVHQLLHLCDAVTLHGSLENYSAFPYESRLGVMKKSICSGNNPLQQAANRTIEQHQFDVICFKRSIAQDQQFPKIHSHSIIFKDFEIKSNDKDCWFFSKQKDIVRFIKTITDSDGNIKICGRRIIHKEDFYVDPIPSSYLNIFFSENILDLESFWNVDDIKHKMWGVTDLKDNKVFFPLLHTL